MQWFGLTPFARGVLTGGIRSEGARVLARVFFPFSTTGPISRADHRRGAAGERLRDGALGKWHLGHLPTYLPTRQGFDLFFGLPYSNDMDEPWYPGQPAPVHPCNSLLPGCLPGVPLMEGERILETPAIQETLTKRYTARASEFMRAAAARGQPFFLYYASHVPHVPLYASEDFLGGSAGGVYGDVIAELDASVGALLREIGELGIDKDTLVVFTSDNGPRLLWATEGRVPRGDRTAERRPPPTGKSTACEGAACAPDAAGRATFGEPTIGSCDDGRLMPTLAHSRRKASAGRQRSTEGHLDMLGR